MNVRDESRALFARPDGADADRSFAVRRDVEARDRTWRVEVAPRPATLDALESPLDFSRFNEIVQRIDEFWFTIVRLPGDKPRPE